MGVDALAAFLRLAEAAQEVADRDGLVDYDQLDSYCQERASLAATRRLADEWFEARSIAMRAERFGAAEP